MATAVAVNVCVRVWSDWAIATRGKPPYFFKRNENVKIIMILKTLMHYFINLINHVS